MSNVIKSVRERFVSDLQAVILYGSILNIDSVMENSPYSREETQGIIDELIASVNNSIQEPILPS